MNKKNEGGLLSLLLGVFIAAIPVIGILVVRKIVLPLLKWAGKKALAALKKYLEKPRTAKQKEVKLASTLPTPDIFKDCQNLAPAKEFKFK